LFGNRPIWRAKVPGQDDFRTCYNVNQSMTLEMSTNKWQITPELKARIAEIRKDIEREDREFEKNPQTCPKHNKPGKFVRNDGAYTRGYAIFECPEGHEFQVG